MSRTILLLNCGSSSLKYQVIDADTEQRLAKGLCQKIGDGVGTIDHEPGDQEFHLDIELADHKVALAEVMKMFAKHGPSLDDVYAVGHRTVHGGERFAAPVKVTEEVIGAVRELIPLAPLHNPACIAGIEAGMAVLPDVPHVSIFDTAFFADLPDEAYTYAIPAQLAEKHGLRRYGFHGTSHDFVSHEAAKFLGLDYADFSGLVCHIGNGASISAIKKGRPVDTTMGLTPLEGLVMGTRSGDIDAGVFKFLSQQEGMGVDDVDTLLNKKSGMLGLAGVSDMRDVESGVAAGDEACVRAFNVYIHRMVKYVGAYSALVGKPEAIVFTAGVGENSSAVRQAVIERFTDWGWKLDEAANAARSKEPRVISAADSAVKVLVIPTNEELQMAREVKRVVG